MKQFFSRYGLKDYTIGYFTYRATWNKNGLGYVIITNNITNIIETEFFI